MTLDCNGKQIIPAGTLVRVRTNNGGEIVAPLFQNYYPTFDVVLNLGGQAAVVPSYRTTIVKEAA
jgi:hypothetical protein